MTEVEKIEIAIKEISQKLVNYERYPERGYVMAIDDIHYLMDKIKTLINEYYYLKLEILNDKMGTIKS